MSGDGGGVALLLVGHGSHRTGESSLPVRLLARRIRARGWFAEVRVGFWKEDPHLSRALDLVVAPEVVVVPVFTSTGYFTDRVVPRELGLSGPVTLSAERTIRYAPPIGTHPRMAGIVLERAAEAMGGAGEAAGATAGAAATAATTTLVVVGHGTDAHPGSADTTRALVERLRGSDPRADAPSARAPYARVEVAFLDQEPRLEAVLAGIEGEVVVVPFFVSDGWHAGITIPEALASPGGRRRLRYAGAVGTHPRLEEVVLDLATEALGWEVPAEAGPPPQGAATPEGPAATHLSPRVADEARFEFLRWVSEGGMEGRTFLETVVKASREGGFEIRHVADRSRPPGELVEIRGPEGAVELAGRTGSGEHRPLATSADLRTGWRIPRLGLDEVWEAYVHLYGTAAVHVGLARRGRLPVVSFAEVAGRQTGMYEGAASLGADGVAAVVASLCVPPHCLRTPVWAPSHPAEPAVVPCPEPCSLLLGRALGRVRGRAGEALDPGGAAPPDAP